MDERIKNNPTNSETQNGSTKGICENCKNRDLCYSFSQQQEWPAFKGLLELYSLVREALGEEIVSAKPQFMPPLNPMVPADYGMIQPKPVAKNPSVSFISDNNPKEEK